MDHSGERVGNGVSWKSRTYVPAYGSYNEYRQVAKTSDGYSIIEIEEDPTHTFIVLRDFLDQWLLVDENYTIPTEGEVTSVAWNDVQSTDPAFCLAISDILDRAEADFTYETEYIFGRTDSQTLRSVHVGYEHCPISSDFVGYMGLVNGV